MGVSASGSRSTSARGMWPRKWSVRWIRSTALTRTTSCSGSSEASGPLSAARTASGTSIARKTRQRSASSAGTVADLELEPPGAPQRDLAIIDELCEPGGRALRAVEIHRRSQHEDDGEMHLVGATLEDGGDREAPIDGDDAGHTAGGERLYAGSERRFRDVGGTQPARITASRIGPGVIAPARRDRGERLAGIELVRRRVGAVLRHGMEEGDLSQQRALIGTEAVAGEPVALQRGVEDRRARPGFQRIDARVRGAVVDLDASLLRLLPDDLLAHQLLDGEGLQPLRGRRAGDRFRDACKRIAVPAHLEPRLVGLHGNGMAVDDGGSRFREGHREPRRRTSTEHAGDDEGKDATTQGEPHYTTLRSGSTRTPAANRSGANALRSIGAAPWTIQAASHLPTTGAIMNPWPEKPPAIQSPACNGPIKGWKSGVFSYNPAQAVLTRASSSGGQRCSATAVMRSRNDQSTRVSSPGGTAGSLMPKSTPSPSGWK